MRIVWIVLAVLTVAAVVVGAWFYVRDEYAFQEVGDDDVTGLTYEGPTGDGWVYGYDPRDARRPATAGSAAGNATPAASR